MEQEFPQAIPPHCDTSLWSGVAPVLALDSQGNPHIGYDTPVEARCHYDPLDGTHFEDVWRAARFKFFPQP